jgi:hypothetical protein
MSNDDAPQYRLHLDLDYARKRNKSRRSKFSAAAQRKRERDDVASATCAICGSRVEGKELHLDHDHVNGKTRGLLCHHCNLGLGMFRDNQKFMQSAIKYLDWWQMLHRDKAA